MRRKSKCVIFFMLFIFVSLLFVVNSSFFYINNVNIVFYDNDLKEISYLKNKFLNTSLQIENIEKTIENDYGTSVFLINKEKYKKEIEQNNPTIKFIDIEICFPNKIVLKLTERSPIFYINDGFKYYILDKEFNLMLILKNKTEIIDDLIEIKGKDFIKQEVNYFQFFGISSCAYYEGICLEDNNILIQKIKNICCYFEYKYIDIKDIVKEIVFCETDNEVNLLCKTKESSNFGIIIEIENINLNFDSKLSKILDGFVTLVNKERIKSTYGRIFINNALNCSWYKL